MAMLAPRRAHGDAPARPIILPDRRLFVPRAPHIIRPREMEPWADPCRYRPRGAIGAPTAIGANNSGTFSSGGNSGTASANVPTGTPLLAIVQTDNPGPTVSTVTDTVGNTYTALKITPATANIVGVGAFYCASSTHAIVSGSTRLTCTTSDGSGWDLDIWVSIGNAGGGGDVASQQLGTTNGTSASISSGTLASASEILFGGIWLASTTSTITESSGFTNIFGAGSGQFTAVGYKIVSATTSITYHPTWTTSQKFTAILISLQETAAGGSFLAAWAARTNKSHPGVATP